MMYILTSSNVEAESRATGGTNFSKAVHALTSTKCSAEKKAPRVYKVDSYCTLEDAVVVKDWDCMLNQTNIGQNNNKFYVIQLLDNWK